MREAIIYAVAMGILAFAGGQGTAPLPIADRSAPCISGCDTPSITKF